MPTIQIKRRVFNELYFPFIYCQAPLQIFYGGSSSGKSAFGAQSRILGLKQEPRNYLIVRKVKDTLRNTIYAETVKAINNFKMSELFECMTNPMQITHKASRRKMIFIGLDDVEKAKSITVENGIITDIDIEEATELTEDDYDKLDLRLRGLCNVTKRKRLFFNPIFRNHWICKRFFEGQLITYWYEKGKILVLHSTHLDNKFLTQQDHDAVESKKGYLYNVYAKGEWGILGDLILTNWDIVDCKDMNFDLTVYGGDFGFSADPAAVLKIGIKANERTLFVQDELYGNGMTNDVLASKAKPIVGDNPVWFDCNEAKSISELRNQGTNSIAAQPVSKGKDSVWHSLQWLQQWRIVIDKGCKHTIDEISQYQWKKDKISGVSLHEPSEVCPNHAMDALRYGTERIRMGLQCGISV